MDKFTNVERLIANAVFAKSPKFEGGMAPTFDFEKSQQQQPNDEIHRTNSSLDRDGAADVGESCPCGYFACGCNAVRKRKPVGNHSHPPWQRRERCIDSAED